LQIKNTILRGGIYIMKGKDLVDFIVENDLLEVGVVVWNNRIEFGTEPNRIEVDEDGYITLIED